MSDTSCSDVVNPYALGWDPEVTPDSFDISLDVNTLFTAVATSIKIYPHPFNHLAIARVIMENVSYLGTQYSVHKKV